MIDIISRGDIISYGHNEYIVDSPKDIAELPITDRQGSSAFVISTGERYILNSNKEWKKVKYR